jgi:hypothetical protein
MVPGCVAGKTSLGAATNPEQIYGELREAAPNGRQYSLAP